MILSEKYRKVMEEIKVTDEMRDRILSDIEKTDFRRKSRITIITKYAVSVAVIAVVIVSAVFIIPKNDDENTVILPEETTADTLQTTENTAIAENPEETESEVYVGDSLYSIETVENVTELSEKVGFEVKDIENIPFEYESAEYISFFGEIAEITYTGESNTLTYRKGKGSEDVSGDYNTYKFTANIEEYNATLSGNEKDLYNLIILHDDEYSYSLSFENGVSEDEVINLLYSLN